MNLLRASEAQVRGSRREGHRTSLMAMRLPAWLYFASLLAAAPSLAQEDATLAGLPLDIPAGSVLLKHERVLRRAYRDVLQGQTRVVLSREVEVAAAMGALTKADYGESDVTLARVAYGAGSLYALYVVVRLNAEGLLVASGRVVRNDGKQMSVGTARLTWLRIRTPEDASREAFLQLFEILGLGRLPAVKEAPPVTVAETALPTAPLESESWPAPAPAPVAAPVAAPLQVPAPAKVDAMMMWWGYGVIGVGLAVAGMGVAGLVTEALAPTDPRAVFQPGPVVITTLGAAVAALGLALVLRSQSGAAVPSVGVSVWATQSSVAVAFGGPF